jgi:hypothetical protein
MLCCVHTPARHGYLGKREKEFRERAEEIL